MLLREKSAITGASVGELIRRALRLSFFADQQSAKECAGEPKIFKVSNAETV